MIQKRANPDHPILEVLQTRWSPRAFADRPVEPDKLKRVLEAARWAASSFNEQPWSFIVATKEQPDEYAKLLACLIEWNQTWAKTAPVLLVTVAKLTFSRNGNKNGMAKHDIGLAVGNLTVQATAEGLYLHQMAGIEPDKVRATYGVPEGYDPLTAIALGYLGDPGVLPADMQAMESAPMVRKPLSQFVFTGRWGEASPVVQ
jgi:nitroreductase